MSLQPLGETEARGCRPARCEARLAPPPGRARRCAAVPSSRGAAESGRRTRTAVVPGHARRRERATHGGRSGSGARGGAADGPELIYAALGGAVSAAAAAAAGPCPRAERGQDEVPEIPDGAADGHWRHPVQSRQSPAAQEEAVVRTRGCGAPTGQWGYRRSTETGAPGAGPGRVDRGQGRRSRAGARGLAAVGRA